jgi:hypothetical protein
MLSSPESSGLLSTRVQLCRQQLIFYKNQWLAAYKEARKERINNKGFIFLIDKVF